MSGTRFNQGLKKKKKGKRKKEKKKIDKCSYTKGHKRAESSCSCGIVYISTTVNRLCMVYIQKEEDGHLTFHR